MHFVQIFWDGPGSYLLTLSRAQQCVCGTVFLPGTTDNSCLSTSGLVQHPYHSFQSGREIRTEHQDVVQIDQKPCHAQWRSFNQSLKSLHQMPHFAVLTYLQYFDTLLIEFDTLFRKNTCNSLLAICRLFVIMCTGKCICMYMIPNLQKTVLMLQSHILAPWYP